MTRGTLCRKVGGGHKGNGVLVRKFGLKSSVVLEIASGNRKVAPRHLCRMRRTVHANRHTKFKLTTISREVMLCCNPNCKLGVSSARKRNAIVRICVTGGVGLSGGSEWAGGGLRRIGGLGECTTFIVCSNKWDRLFCYLFMSGGDFVTY